MKKYVISLLAVLVVIAASSFTSGVFKSKGAGKAAMFGVWWDFHGTSTIFQSDPSYYSLDEDNFPDCPIVSGLVYCEVRAYPSQWNSEEPDLSTINDWRMKP